MPISKALSILSILLLAGCMGQPQRDGPVKARELSLADMAKSDIDMVAEVSVRQANQYLQDLAEKLYRRNPNQLPGPGETEGRLGRALERLAAGERPVQLGGRRAADVITLAFADDYRGDRVAAFIIGLRDMQLDAYGSEREFFLYHSYDPQKLYYLARNLEIASWRLRHKRGAGGRLFLLSSGQDGKGVANISFERLFGKLIALHDHFAHVVADSTNRRIKNVVQGLASAVFFPI